MVIPQWVVNEKKYERAITEAKKVGLPYTEENLKALYVKYGGLIQEVIAEGVVEESKEEEKRKPGRPKKNIE